VEQGSLKTESTTNSSVQARPTKSTTVLQLQENVAVIGGSMLLATGVNARLVVFEGMLHAHWAYLDLPESKEAFEIQARFFEAHLGFGAAVSSR
jgi:hypothetical protein